MSIFTAALGKPKVKSMKEQIINRWEEVFGELNKDAGFYLIVEKHEIGYKVHKRYAPNSFKDELLSTVQFHKDGNIYKKTNKKRVLIAQHNLSIGL